LPARANVNHIVLILVSIVSEVALLLHPSCCLLSIILRIVLNRERA
jgi:hypothetical protein